MILVVWVLVICSNESFIEAWTFSISKEILQILLVQAYVFSAHFFDNFIDFLLEEALLTRGVYAMILSDVFDSLVGHDTF